MIHGNGTVAGIARVLDLTPAYLSRRLAAFARAGYVIGDGRHYRALPKAADTSPGAALDMAPAPRDPDDGERVILLHAA